MKKHIVCGVVAAVAIVAVAGRKDANVFSRISCDTSSLPQEQRFVADLLASRIEARTPPSNSARTLTVRFAIDASVPGENAGNNLCAGEKADCKHRLRGTVALFAVHLGSLAD